VMCTEETHREYRADIEDYSDFVLGRNQPKESRAPKTKKDRRADARSRDEARAIRDAVREAEQLIARLQGQIGAIDQALIDPAAAAPELSALAAGELAKRRSVVALELEAPQAPGR